MAPEPPDPEAPDRLMPDRVAIRHALDSGIEAVARAAGTVTDGAATPCTDWSARDLVRHLEAIAGAYVLWVAAAMGGRVGIVRSGADLTRWNATLLARLPQRSTSGHLARFAALADDHRRLVDEAGDVAMVQTPTGMIWSVADHAGVAAVEWHVHAWDLARAGDGDHVPSPDDAGTLHAVWDGMLADVTAAPLRPADDLWSAILIASGRTP